jgi:hypothetical protein
MGAAGTKNDALWLYSQVTDPPFNPQTGANQRAENPSWAEWRKFCLRRLFAKKANCCLN